VKAQNKKRLESAGWRVGNPAEFLDLSAEEATFVEVKLALADYLKHLRAKQHWTQTTVAKRLNSSQSRIAKMEAADPSVSVDLLMRALLSLGASRKELGRVIAARAA
jgi:DNA-binding XRE family transcriptional regulator